MEKNPLGLKMHRNSSANPLLFALVAGAVALPLLVWRLVDHYRLPGSTVSLTQLETPVMPSPALADSAAVRDELTPSLEESPPPVEQPADASRVGATELQKERDVLLVAQSVLDGTLDVSAIASVAATLVEDLDVDQSKLSPDGSLVYQLLVEPQALLKVRPGLKDKIGEFEFVLSLPAEDVGWARGTADRAELLLRFGFSSSSSPLGVNGLISADLRRDEFAPYGAEFACSEDGCTWSPIETTETIDGRRFEVGAPIRRMGPGYSPDCDSMAALGKRLVAIRSQTR